MNKVIFFDRDGVLNEDPGYVHKVEDFKLLPGVVEGLKLLKDFKFILITNQSGIGRGYYTIEDFHKFNNHLVGELKKEGIDIERTYCCPHHPDDKCDCRKPNIKFIEEAKREFDIDLSKSWVVGDHPHDIKMGIVAGCKTIYMLTGHGEKHKDELGDIKPDFIAKEFLEAVQFIIK
ncbi:HAD family hydrolase [Candidatus Woesearchaeota archaeon]|nr:HAD family hydrolase [Candidatus Woesearchaeota archaeon]